MKDKTLEEVFKSNDILVNKFYDAIEKIKREPKKEEVGKWERFCIPIL